MMSTLKKSLIGLAVSAALGVSSSANATLVNWYLDSDGGGGNAPVLVPDNVGLIGSALIRNIFAAPPADGVAFTFEEVATFSSFNVGPPQVEIEPDLVSTFVGTGSGVIGGALTFATGTLVVENDLGAPIATFDLVSGSALLDAPGGVLPNGVVSLIFKATSLNSGFFFDNSMNDLAPLVASPGGLLFGFATTNVTPYGNGQAAEGGLVTQFNNEFVDLVSTTVDQQSLIQIENGGQFRLQVPEPGSLALLGLGMAGLGLSIRKRR